jgi:hypothetical protein
LHVQRGALAQDMHHVLHPEHAVPAVSTGIVFEYTDKLD